MQSKCANIFEIQGFRGSYNHGHESGCKTSFTGPFNTRAGRYVDAEFIGGCDIVMQMLGLMSDSSTLLKWHL